MHLIMLVATTAIVGCTAAPDDKDVTTFLERRSMCDYFRGEVNGEHGRRNDELVANANKYCVGTDAELKTLKTRYARDPAAMSKLNELKEDIEP